MDSFEFGKFIKELRKRRGLTLMELSEASSVSQPHLSHIENGKRGIPSPEILKKLAGPLDISYSHLMFKAGHLDDGSLLIGEKLTPPKDIFVESFPIFSANGFTTEGVTFSSDQAKIVSGLMQKAKRESRDLEITNYFKQTDVAYNGRKLTEQDKQRILDMLKVLFPEDQTSS